MILNDQLNDIQGIVMRGYGYMPFAKYFLLQINDAAKARKWLQYILPSVTDGKTKPENRCINLAFTKVGFDKIGLAKDSINMFSLQFQEGMTTESSQRMLGDDVSQWEWGGKSEIDDLHIMLLLFTPSEETLSNESTSLKNKLQTAQIGVLHEFDTSSEVLKKGLEHFGFKDGIAQPVINKINRRTGKEEPEENQIKPGEILLGYKNEYDIYPYSPTVSKESDVNDHLPTKFNANKEEEQDFGKNGTYLVFRQLSQKVKAFWDYIEENSNGEDKSHSRDLLASKIMGRWRSGAPLAKCPFHDDQEVANDPDKVNSFGYHSEDDVYGYKCPVGSHLRRSNPRDSFVHIHKYPKEDIKKPEKDSKRSVEFVKRHRIMRRGRPYGDPLHPSMQPEDYLIAQEDNKERGLHFICLNANIARQFELIQQTWVNGKFNGLYDDPDPINGGALAKGKNFTVQAKPLRKRYTNLPQFIDTKGGAYFFIPSINALKYLADLI